MQFGNCEELHDREVVPFPVFLLAGRVQDVIQACVQKNEQYKEIFDEQSMNMKEKELWTFILKGTPPRIAALSEVWHLWKEMAELLSSQDSGWNLAISNLEDSMAGPCPKILATLRADKLDELRGAIVAWSKFFLQLAKKIHENDGNVEAISRQDLLNTQKKSRIMYDAISDCIKSSDMSRSLRNAYQTFSWLWRQESLKKKLTEFFSQHVRSTISLCIVVCCLSFVISYLLLLFIINYLYSFF